MIINAYRDGRLVYTGYIHLAAKRFGFSEEKAEYYLRTHNEGFNFRPYPTDVYAEDVIYYICEREW